MEQNQSFELWPKGWIIIFCQSFALIRHPSSGGGSVRKRWPITSKMCSMVEITGYTAGLSTLQRFLARTYYT
ncbi:hypothetical protein TNCV_2747711 [Trichonephila clavipes]|nr:hypothetical protein TNCV_2747711 [Trichonephila clavipes]